MKLKTIIILLSIIAFKSDAQNTTHKLMGDYLYNGRIYAFSPNGKIQTRFYNDAHRANQQSSYVGDTCEWQGNEMVHTESFFNPQNNNVKSDIKHYYSFERVPKLYAVNPATSTYLALKLDSVVYISYQNNAIIYKMAEKRSYKTAFYHLSPLKKINDYKVGDVFPDYNLPANAYSRILVLYPTRDKKKTDYAPMLEQFLMSYYDNGYTFTKEKTCKRVEVVRKTADHDKGYYQQWQIDTFKTDNESAILLFMNDDNQIIYIDRDFRAQGEHIKPLDKAIKQYLGCPDDFYVSKNKKQAAWKVGDYVGDFELEKGKKIIDYDSIPLLLTFYPAAFSGSSSFLKENEALDQKKALEAQQIHQERMKTDLTYQLQEQMKMRSCSGQLFDLNATLTQSSSKVFAITSATDELLRVWKGVLPTPHIHFLNDPDYRLAQLFQSYNEAKGYNNRCSFIIQKGIIAYIDWDFEAGDADILNKKLWELALKYPLFLNFSPNPSFLTLPR